MATKLTPETLAEIQYIARHNARLFPKEANALLDHITALEERIHFLKELSGLRAGVITEKDARITALEEELKAAQEEMSSHQCLPKKVRDDAINDFRAQLVEAVRQIQSELGGPYDGQAEGALDDVIQLISTFEAGE